MVAVLLAGRSKAVRNQACEFLKRLWLLESARALSSKVATSAPAQHAQRAMLSLLLHWVPSLSGYPESVTLYFQLLTWVIRVTPTLPEQLKGEAGGAKKKAGSSGNPKIPPKAPQQGAASGSKPKPGSSSSDGSGLSMTAKAEAMMQETVSTAAVQQMFGAVKRHNAVLADHLHGSTYQSLQVCVTLATQSTP